MGGVEDEGPCFGAGGRDVKGNCVGWLERKLV